MLTLLTSVLSLIIGASQPDNARPSETRIEATPTMMVTKDVRFIERPGADDGLTSLDVYQPTGQSPDDIEPTPRPILIYIHGGGWAIGDKSRVYEKPDWALRNDWVLVSVNYRLSPQVMHPEHARDVAAAIAYIHQHAEDFGGDPTKIVIMGHSAGAHLAGIVASEESLLGEHQLGPDDLSGVVLLDGAGYNIPNQMKSKLLLGKTRSMFEEAFGTDPDLWVSASPTLQAMVDEILPPLLAVHVPRFRSRVESIELVKVWNKTSSRATRHQAPDKNHATLNHSMGKKNDPDTRVVEEFIRSVFEQDVVSD